MISLKDNRHDAYCSWLIDRACENKNTAQQIQIRGFHQKLLTSLNSLVTGIETVSSNTMLVQRPSLLTLVNLLLTLIPFVGEIATTILNGVSDKKKILDAIRLNDMLGDARERIIQRFCAEAIYYYHGQILIPGNAMALPKVARNEVEKILSQLPLGSSVNTRELAEKITLQFAKSLALAAQTPFDYPASNPDKLMRLMTDHIHVVKSDPVVNISQNALTPIHSLSPSNRWVYANQVLRLSLLTYEHETKIYEVAKDWGYNVQDPRAFEFKLIEVDNIRCVVLANKHQVYISFRGYDSASDVLTNLKINLVKVNGLGEVHSGYHYAYTLIKEQLNDILRFNASNKVPFVFTGHDMGGAIAVLAGADYALRGYPTQIITMGQPKIGTKFENHAVATLNNCLYRFVTQEDPVVHGMIGYSDVGSLYVLPAVDMLFDWEHQSQVASLVKLSAAAHTLSSYQERIKGHARNELIPIAEIDYLERLFIDREVTIQPVNNTLFSTFISLVYPQTAPILPVGLSDQLAKYIEQSISTQEDAQKAGLDSINLLIRTHAAISVDCLRVLERHLWRPDFSKYSTRTQYAIVSLFSRGVEQYLFSGETDYEPIVTNGIVKLDKLKNQANISPQYSNEIDLVKIYLGCIRQQFNEQGQYYSSIAKLLEREGSHAALDQQAFFDAIELLLKTDYFKSQKTLAEAIIVSYVAHSPKYLAGFTVAAQSYLYTQRGIAKPMHWHYAALELLLRKAQNAEDVWPIIMGEYLTSAPTPVANTAESKIPQLETMLIGLNYWLKGEARFTPDPFGSLTLNELLQSLTVAHPNDALLTHLLNTYVKHGNWQEITKQSPQRSPLHQALQSARQDKTMEADARFKAWKCYEALLTQNQLSLSVEDCMNMADCAQDIGQSAFAIHYYKMGHDLATKSAESGGHVMHLASIKVKLMNLLYSTKKQEAVTPWQKAKNYMEMIDYASSMHPMHNELFNCVLSPGLTAIQEGLVKLVHQNGIESEMDRKAAIDKGEVLIHDLFGKYWMLKKDFVNDLFEGDHIRPENKIRNPGDADIHNVAQVGDLHFKENPGCSGLAFAAWALSATFYLDDNPNATALGFIPALPAKIIRNYQGKEQIIYVQITPHALGESLKSVLDKNPTALTHSSLNQRAFSAVFILSLLLDLEDGRSQNWFFEQGLLTSIDNDHILIRELYKKGKLEIKNILFCLDEMDYPIHEDIRRIVTDMLRSPLPRMRLWLLLLKYYTEQIHRNYTSVEIESVFNRSNDRDKVVLEPFFHPNAMERLYIKWFKIRSALQNVAGSDRITHHDLHLSVQSEVAKNYGNLRKKYTQPLQRFKEVMPGTQTTSTSQIVGKVSPPKSVMSWVPSASEYSSYKDFKANCSTPSQLILFLSEFQKSSNAIELVIGHIKQGYLGSFIEMSESQVAVLLSIKSEVYEQMTNEFHQSFLNAINSNSTELTIKNNPRITDNQLVMLVDRIPGLTRLTVDGCGRITGYYSKRLFEEPRDWLIDFCNQGVDTIKIINCEAIDSRLLYITQKGLKKRSVSVEIKLLLLLRLVAEREQERVESMIRADSSLLRQRGNVSDPAGITDTHITALQYAILKLDWHMWTMILKYLPQDEAQAQVKELDTDDWRKSHTDNADALIQNLIDQLQLYYDNFNVWSDGKLKAHWCRQVGRAQRRLPMHVINQMCRSDQPFIDSRNFLELTLPQAINVDVGSWFSAVYEGGKLGETWAGLRGEGKIVRAIEGYWHPDIEGGYRGGSVDDFGGNRGGTYYPARPFPLDKQPSKAAVQSDIKALKKLLAVRIEQRNQLLASFKDLNANTQIQSQTASTHTNRGLYFDAATTSTPTPMLSTPSSVQQISVDYPFFQY